MTEQVNAGSQRKREINDNRNSVNPEDADESCPAVLVRRPDTPATRDYSMGSYESVWRMLHPKCTTVHQDGYVSKRKPHLKPSERTKTSHRNLIPSTGEVLRPVRPPRSANIRNARNPHEHAGKAARARQPGQDVEGSHPKLTVCTNSLLCHIKPQPNYQLFENRKNDGDILLNPEP